jgi:glycosyltransferase involved in cell wall biosynthesis
VGHLSELKGINQLNSIISKLAESIKITLAGTWDPRCLEIRKNLESKQNISILDYVEHRQVASLMKRAKIFLFPSLIEGAARVIDEAIFSGCLVMATSASFADNDQKAIYIDSLQDLEIVEEIEFFINNSGERQAYTDKALIDLQNRNQEYFAELINFYRQILK